MSFSAPVSMPRPERGEGHEADAEGAAGVEHAVGLGVAGPERIFALDGGDGVGGMRPLQRLGAGFGEAERADLPSFTMLGHGADRLLDRHGGIDAVLVKEIDDLNVEPLQRRFGDGAQMLRPAVHAGGAGGAGRFAM